MTRICALLFVVALLLNAASCAHVQPVVNAVVTCSGETISPALVDAVYRDVMTENWFDLASNVVPLLKEGYADVECIWGYLSKSNPETVPHIQKLRAKHAAEFKGSVSLRSPGDATTKTGPTAAVVKVDSIGTIDAASPGNIPVLSGDLSLPVVAPDLLIVAQRHADFATESIDCGDEMRSVTPMAPGVVCLRNGVTFTEVLCKMKREEAKPYPFTATFSGSGDPWAEAVIDLMHALPAGACSVFGQATHDTPAGRMDPARAPAGARLTLDACDQRCGGRLRGLPVDRGTSCMCAGAKRWTRDQDARL